MINVERKVLAKEIEFFIIKLPKSKRKKLLISLRSSFNNFID